MQLNIDANDIIENLLNEIKLNIRENAMLKAQIKVMSELIEAKELENEQHYTNRKDVKNC